MKSQNCSIKDLADYVGVATSTVSRVLNNRNADTHTSESTRRKILAAAQTLNYVPNINAKRLFSRRSDVIALVLPSYEQHGKHVLADHHLSEIFSGIESGLNKTNYRLLIIFNDERFVQKKEYLSLFRQHAIDGMLIWGAYEGQLFWTELAAQKYSMMFLSQPTVPPENCSYMVHDYRQAGELALSHLVQSGHRQIGWIGGVEHNGIVLEMQNGFAQVKSDCRLYPMYGDFSVRCGAEQAREILRHHPEITGLLTANIDVAIGASEVLTEHKSKIKVVACDSATESEGERFARVCVDDQKLGRTAVENLIHLMQSTDSVNIRQCLPVKLYPGE